jgi:hypothetical protein
VPEGIGIEFKRRGGHVDDKEKRQHRRQHVNIPAELFVQGQPHPCSIRDISESGFFVVMELFSPIGEKIFLSAKDIPMIEKAGRTVRIDRSGIGGMFEEKGIPA